MKYSKHSLGAKSNRKIVTDWAFKEGVFQTPSHGDYIARIKIKGTNRYSTLSRHKTKEEAEAVYNLRRNNAEKDLILKPENEVR